VSVRCEGMYVCRSHIVQCVCVVVTLCNVCGLTEGTGWPKKGRCDLEEQKMCVCTIKGRDFEQYLWFRWKMNFDLLGFITWVWNLIFIGPCIVIYSYSTTNKMHLLFQMIYSCKTLYMIRTVFPSIIRRSKLRIQQRYMSNSCCYLLLSGMRWN
jgi:hypothetical protein